MSSTTSSRSSSTTISRSSSSRSRSASVSSSASKSSPSSSPSSRHDEALSRSNHSALPSPSASSSNHDEDSYSNDYTSDIATESTVVCEPIPVDERQRLIESYAQFKKTKGKLEVYASESTRFTPDPSRKITPTKVHGLVQRLYRPHLLLQRTKEDMRRRKEEVTVENFDSVNDKHLAKYWSHRRHVEAKQSKRREEMKNKSAAQSNQKENPTTPSSTTKETSNPRGNDAATPAPRPRCLPAIVAQEGDSSKRLVVANGGRTLLLQDDNISDDSDSLTTASMRTPSIADTATSGGRSSVAPQGKVSPAELSSLWLLADPPSELAPTVRGLSITDANTMGVDLSWMAVHKREVHKLKDDLPSPHRFGRKKYQLKCQRQDSKTSLASTPSKKDIGSTRELVEDFVDRVINGALEVSAAGAGLSPTKSTASSRSINKTKGPSGLRVTLLDIQLEPSEESNLSEGTQGEVLDVAPERINSPRSCLVMLRNGTALSDLTPIPFAAFVKEGTLVGVPKFASEKRYLSKESKRRQLLRRLQTEYSSLCGEAPRDEFMDMLMASKPGAVVEDTSAFAQIIDYKRSRQQESAARYADKLDTLVQMTKNKCIKIKAQNDKLQQFEAARVARWKEEADERERQRELKAMRLQCVREDAKEIANLQRNGLLTKLGTEDDRRKKMDVERQRKRQLESENQKEDADTKRKQQMRHTRLEELRRAQAADRIRQKMAKIDRQKKMSEELLKQMRYEQEMAKLRDELTRKAAEEDILAYRRKHQV